MKIIMKFLVPVAMGLLLSSCSQKDSEFKVEDGPLGEDFEAVEDYLQLQLGNYWVYESHSVNLETGEDTPLHKRDSIYVLKDTLIGSFEYFILEGSRLGQAYRSILRCSGPELMDADGFLLFSTASAGEIANLPARHLPDAAESGEASLIYAPAVEVPYGTFDALEYRRTFYLYSSEEIRAGGDVRRQSDYFAKGVGLIQYTSFFPNQPLDIEMRLVRSNVR